MKKPNYRKNRTRFEKGGPATISSVCDPGELKMLQECADEAVRRASTQERSRITQEYPDPISGFKADGAGVTTLITLLETRLEADFFRKGWKSWQLRVVALYICQHYVVEVGKRVRIFKAKSPRLPFSHMDLRDPNGFQLEVFNHFTSEDSHADELLDFYPWVYNDLAGDPTINWEISWRDWAHYSNRYAWPKDEVAQADHEATQGTGEYVSAPQLSPFTRDIDIQPISTRVEGTKYSVTSTGELIVHEDDSDNTDE